MAYLPKLNPTVGGGLGGLPERRATSAASPNSVQRSIIGQAVKGSFAYRNTTTGDTYSLDPIEGLTEEANLVLTSKINQVAVAVAMFDDGKFVIAYSNASGVCIEIYNFDGTVNVSQVVVDNLYVAGKRISVAINPLNEYINIFYASGTSGNTIRRAVYSKTGTVVSAGASLITTINTSDDPGVLDADFFDDGWFVTVHRTGTLNEHQSRIFNASGTQVASYSHSWDYVVGRLAIKTLTTPNHTYAVTFTQAAGFSGLQSRGFVQLLQELNGSIFSQRNFLIADIGGTTTDRLEICYNEIDKKVVGFHCSDTFLFMTPSQLYYSDSAVYSPPERKYLTDSNPQLFTATGLGGDRYLVTFGRSTTLIHVGIVNSLGDWIAPPTHFSFIGSYSFDFLKSAASKITGRSVVVAPSGTTLVIKTFNYRNTSTETYRLRDEYPVKLVDFNPFVLPSYPLSFSVHATVSTNKFVTSWVTGYGRDATWAIYSSGGTLLNGPYINSSILSAGTNLQSMKTLLLPNGNVAVIICSSTTIKLGIYDSANTLQGSIITVSTNSTTMEAEVASNGNICIISRNQSNGLLERTIYSQTGTVVAALSTQSSQSIVAERTRIVYSQVNNAFLVAFKNTSTNYYRYMIFGDTGTSLVGDNSFGSTAMEYVALCANSDGTYTVVLDGSSSTVYFAKVNAGGTLAVSLTATAQKTQHGFTNGFQLLPNTTSEVMLLNFDYTTSHINNIALSNTTGAAIFNKKSFGIASAWDAKYYAVEGANYQRYNIESSHSNVMVSTSLNGDKYIATPWGEVFRLSPALPVGDYVIDGVVNADAINSTVEVVTNGLVTRPGKVPRLSAFIANTTGTKKIIASNTMTAIGS